MARIRARLIVSGQDLDPDKVTDRLGVQPDVRHRRGDPNIGPDGRRYADHKIGLWAIDSGLPETASLSEHIQAIIGRVSAGLGAVSALRGSAEDVYFLVGLFLEKGNEAVPLGHRLAKAVGEAAVDIDFDIYWEGPEDVSR